MIKKHLSENNKKSFKKIKKTVDKQKQMMYIIRVAKIQPNCVRVAQQTLTLYVWVRILVPQPLAPNTFRGCFIEVWRSLVARFVRDEEVAGSNPVTSTSKKG